MYTIRMNSVSTPAMGFTALKVSTPSSVSVPSSRLIAPKPRFTADRIASAVIIYLGFSRKLR